MLGLQSDCHKPGRSQHRHEQTPPLPPMHADPAVAVLELAPPPEVADLQLESEVVDDNPWQR